MVVQCARKYHFLLPALLLLAVPLLVGFQFPGAAQRLWRQADNAFRHKDYQKAAGLYQQAQADRPDQWALKYNQGVAEAGAKKLDEAVKDLQQVANSGPQQLKEPSEYNTGNCYLAQHNAKQAIAAYKRALYLNPNDMNAKWNLELAERKQQQQRRQQQSQQNQHKQQNQKQKQQGQKPQTGRPKNQQRTGQQPQSRQMSKSEARSLLQSLSQEDRNLQKQMARYRNQPTGPEIPPAKDW